MPFVNQIVSFINDNLKGGSLNKEILQPAKYYGLTSIVARKSLNKTEQLPAVISADGKAIPITTDSKYAIQVYHKLVNKTYSFDKKSYGEDWFIKSVSELNLVVLSNSKITGKTKDILEPVVLFGMPQKLSPALISELKINSCLITPIGSNMNHLEVFKQEYPQSEYFLNEQMSMFSIRYKVETTFSKDCVEQCLCD